MATTDIERERQEQQDDLRRSRLFWDRHYQTYQEQYPDHFIAVHRWDEKFVAAHTDFHALVAELGKQGLSQFDVWYKWIPEPGVRHHV